jgi:hypothetical protein
MPGGGAATIRAVLSSKGAWPEDAMPSLGVALSPLRNDG